jgi:hypothetical protein
MITILKLSKYRQFPLCEYYVPPSCTSVRVRLGVQAVSNFRYAVSCHVDAVMSDYTIVLRNISNLLTPLNSLCRQNKRKIHMPITYATVCAKALALFKMLKEEKMRRLWRKFFCKLWVVWSLKIKICLAYHLLEANNYNSFSTERYCDKFCL